MKSTFNKEKIVLFGAGRYGVLAAKMFRYDKEILCFIDNDSQKWGGTVEGYPIFPPSWLQENKDDSFRVVISTAAYAPIVVQLEKIGSASYVYFEDMYAFQYQCKSRILLDRHIEEFSKGQYVGRDIKNQWMNHIPFHYSGACYEKFIPPKGKVLDIGSGCGTSLFHWLLLGYDAYGIDCCQWKLDFCRQKIEDFNFPQDWNEHFLFGYGEDLPFDDNSMDVVTSWYVLEHVNDWEKCLGEMIRVVRPHGVIILNAPDYRNSYEEHYGVDIGMPMVDHQQELKRILIEKHKSLEVFEELNFITKTAVLQTLDQYRACVQIFDLERHMPMVFRANGALKYRRSINLIIQKIG